MLLFLVLAPGVRFSKVMLEPILTIFAYEWRVRLLKRPMLALSKDRKQLFISNIMIVATTCRRVLKLVLNSYDIFRVV